MTNPVEKYKTITNFRLPHMVTKIIIESTEPLTEFKKHGEVFRQLQNIMQNFNNMTISELPDLLEALKVVENIKTVEIINPMNNNGFIFEF